MKARTVSDLLMSYNRKQPAQCLRHNRSSTVLRWMNEWLSIVWSVSSVNRATIHHRGQDTLCGYVQSSHIPDTQWRKVPTEITVGHLAFMQEKWTVAWVVTSPRATPGQWRCVCLGYYTNTSFQTSFQMKALLRGTSTSSLNPAEN